ncbi:MAG TPA: NUDIX hydrolase, partial [Pseudomonadota bacterium]|nr:NUDIX hydrolase [Pseudomonadota bacterium]
FTASDYEGTPTETAEAIPLFFPLDAIPYDQMWDDNRYWLPHVLLGQRIRGYSTFCKQKLVDHRLTTT